MRAVSTRCLRYSWIRGAFERHSVGDSFAVPSAFQLGLKESALVTPEMSVVAQHALQDMVEGQMYLLAKSHRVPWSLLPRTTNSFETRKVHSASVELSAANELLGLGFIEATSSLTFVVSKPGYQFYQSRQER